MSKTIDVHGQKVGYEELKVPDKLPERIRKFIDGGLGSDGLGRYLRTLSDRIAEQYTGKEDYVPRDNIIHISDVSYCLAKAYLRRRYPDWENRYPEQRWDSKRHLARGTIQHAGITSLFPTSEKDVSFPLPGADASLTGRLDFVDQGICYELKWSSDYATSKIKREGPYPWHVEPLLYYSWCRKYPEMRLMYWSSNSIDLYRVGMEGRDEIIRNLADRAVELHESLKNENPPEPEPGYSFKSECDYCEYGPNVCGDEALCDGEKVEEPEEGPEEGAMEKLIEP